MNLKEVGYSALCALSLCTSLAWGSTRDEIVQELDEIRHDRKELRMRNNTHPFVKEYIDRIDEDKLL